MRRRLLPLLAAAAAAALPSPALALDCPAGTRKVHDMATMTDRCEPDTSAPDPLPAPGNPAPAPVRRKARRIVRPVADRVDSAVEGVDDAARGVADKVGAMVDEAHRHAADAVAHADDPAAVAQAVEASKAADAAAKDEPTSHDAAIRAAAAPAPRGASEAARNVEIDRWNRVLLTDDEFDRALDRIKARVRREHPTAAARYTAIIDQVHERFHGEAAEPGADGATVGDIFRLGRTVDHYGDAIEAKKIAEAAPGNRLARQAYLDSAERYKSSMSEMGGTAAGMRLHEFFHDIAQQDSAADGGIGPLPPQDAKKHNEGMISANPGSPFPLLFDGRHLLANGDAAGAAARAGEALALDPKNSDALSLRASANFQLKDYAAAASDARSALAINPKDRTAAAILSLAQGRGGAGGAPASASSAGGGAGTASGSSSPAGFGAFAARDFGAPAGGLGAASPGAQQSLAYTRQAISSLSLRDYSAAIAHATRAIEANPGNAQAYNLRAMAYNKAGRFKDALRDAEAGLKLDPKNSVLLNTKAYALNKLRMHREALEAAGIALEANPNDATAWRLRAEALAGLGDRTGMLDALRKAAALDVRHQVVLEAALQLPADADLNFLFADDDLSASRSGQAGGGRSARRFGVVAGAAVVGGFLIALGLLQFLLPPLKGAWTRITRRGPAAAALPASGPPTPAPSSPFPSAVPELLRGQYKVLRQIGAGGMGVVYEGTDVSLGRRVAIKKMRDELRSDRRERERFLSEAKLVASLHHPHIVDIYAIVEEGDDVYLVFEYIPGKTVHELVFDKTHLSYIEAVAVFRGVCRALDYAHGKNVIHRDLKPSNIMVSEEGFVKVMDFGIARLAKDAMNRFSMTNTVVGTPPYMAPEQEQGVVRREADLYALAICLYEMLCGVGPFSGTGAGMLMNKINRSYVPPSRLVEGLPAGVDETFARALDPDPDKRFHSAREMLEAFEALAARTAPATPPRLRPS